MYIYIHEENFTNSKYFKIWNKILSRLNTLGIYDKKIQITPFSNNLQALLQTEFRKGKHTLVVVGNDNLFLRLANSINDFDRFTLAYIPLEHSYLSKILGIPPQELACDVLSARILSSLDLINVNNKVYSVSPLKLPMDNIKIADKEVNWVLRTIEENYKLFINVNSDLWKDKYENLYKNLDNVNWNNNKIKLVIYTETEKHNIFSKNYDLIDYSFIEDDYFFLKNRNENEELEIKDLLYKNKILKISLLKNALKIIVGKNRKIS